MRALQFLGLTGSLAVGYYATLHAQEFCSYLGTQPTEIQILVTALLACLLFIWFLFLKIEVNKSHDASSKEIGTQKGRETGGRLRQKSVDPDDREEAIRQISLTGDQRRSLRHNLLLKGIFPYIVLFGVGLFLIVGCIASIPSLVGG
jgi:hypothetical protein